ncbi:MAG: hypothetical protein ACYC3K_16795 [Candidatus Nanopelagicales bacterium]
MKRLSIALTAAAFATAMLPGGSAWGTDGSTAVDMCKRLAHCISSVSSKGDVLIMTNDGHQIECPSLTEQCVITGRPGKVSAAPEGGGTYQPPPSLVESESPSGAAPASQPAAPGSGPIL